jgi:cysteine desulfurase
MRTRPPRPIYLDHHATTPVHDDVLQSMLPYFSEKFGNATSHQHAFGWAAKSAIDHARESVCRALNLDPKTQSRGVIWTSGATESIHLAVLGCLDFSESSQSVRQIPFPHIITSAAEHKCTLEVFEKARRLGCEVTILEVDSNGAVSKNSVLQAIKKNTRLVSLMHANNEVGTLTPISEIGPELAKRNILFHVDAAQTFAKEQIDFEAWGIDMISISAHKFFGPKGVGALFVRQPSALRPDRIELASYFVGGGQEHGLRGGTHNVPGIVGLAAATELMCRRREEFQLYTTKLRDQMWRRISQAAQDFGVQVQLNGDVKNRLCNNLNFSIENLMADEIIPYLPDVAYSSASACSEGGTSHVLRAMSASSREPRRFNINTSSTLRFGLGWMNTQAEIDWVCDRIEDCFKAKKASAL